MRSPTQNEQQVFPEQSLLYGFPQGSFAYEATQTHVPFVKYQGEKDMKNIWEAVHDGAGFGVIPRENGNAGVTDYLPELMKGGIEIVADVQHHVDMRVAGVVKTLDWSHVKKVHAHPIAKQQSQEWMRENLPINVEVVKAGNNVEALERMQAENDPHTIALGSRKAIASLGLHLLTPSNIAKNPDQNFTQFMIVKKVNGDGMDVSAPYHAMALHPQEGRPGVLADILEIIADNGMNLQSFYGSDASEMPQFYLEGIQCPSETNMLKLTQQLIRRVPLISLGSWHLHYEDGPRVPVVIQPEIVGTPDLDTKEVNFTFIPENKLGALARITRILQQGGLNLKNLGSSPIGRQEYQFPVKAVRHGSRQQFLEILDNLYDLCPVVRWEKTAS